jgi:biopolymer transport protein ExbB/TolQ
MDPMVLLLLSAALVVISLGLFVAVPHSLVTAVLVSLAFVVSTALAILASSMLLDQQERRRWR